MSNVHRVLIEGKLPFDVVNRGNENVKLWFARFSSPSFGFSIVYGKTSTEPVPESNGKYTYYDFKISGEEAVWGSHVEQFCEDLKNAGAKITKQEIEDIEC